jgi:acetylornithine deacetylase/succinyl-diaminopimelate desuccinylase-like protein
MERDTIDLLKDLVAIDSQNSSLVPGAAGEGRIAGYVADWAEGAGLAAEIVEGTPGRPSVLVRPGRPSVLVRSGGTVAPILAGPCCCAGTWTPWGSAR